MRLLRRIVRIILLLLWCAVTVLPAALSLIFVRRWDRIRRGARWAQIWIAGVKVICHGDIPADHGRLLVSNHLGYMDILAHGSLFPIRFAPKAEIRRWFGIGQLVALSMPVWIDRKSPLSSGKIAGIFRDTIANGISLLVYPEGTSTDGKHGLLPFKSTSFAALPENGKILPMVIFYRQTPEHLPSAAWFDHTPFPEHVWNVLGLQQLIIEVFILPEISQLPGEGRKELASRVRDAMVKEYNRHERIS